MPRSHTTYALVYLAGGTWRVKEFTLVRQALRFWSAVQAKGAFIALPGQAGRAPPPHRSPETVQITAEAAALTKAVRTVPGPDGWLDILDPSGGARPGSDDRRPAGGTGAPRDPGGPAGPPVLDRAYPDWFLREPLSGLRLPPASKAAVEEFGTVGDLRSVPERYLLAAPDWGRGRLGSFREAIRAYFEERLVTWLEAQRARSWKEDEILLGALEEAFGRLPARTALILGRRLGIDGKCLTYRECAADLGITAEWARQIEAKGLASPVFERLWGPGAVSPLAGLGGDADGDVAALLSRPWAAGLSEESLRALLRVAGRAGAPPGERISEGACGVRTGAGCRAVRSGRTAKSLLGRGHAHTSSPPR